jgi:predicted transcriptional regulator|tara:strand:+ start:187 stop:525 length:339 start_codon:yes stop_codon:yes gene_type:complete
MNQVILSTIKTALRAHKASSKLDAIKFFCQTHEHWSLLLNVIDTHYKDMVMTKSDLLAFLECSYKTKNTYIKEAIGRGYFLTKDNPKDKRSVIITPSYKMLSQFKKYSSLVN